MAATATRTHSWSKFQTDLYNFIENDDRSAIVEAVAGSGKTTALVECASRLCEWDNAAAVAFNTRIKDELTKRLPAFVPALTLNALGFRAWKSFIGKSVEVDKFKIATLVRELSDDNNPDYRKGVKRLVDLAKMTGVVPGYVTTGCRGLVDDTEEVWQGLIEEYGVYFGWGDKNDRAIELSRRVLAESIKLGGTRIDFNDQLYLPVIFSADFPQYDILFVDEAQDVSEIQRVMIERSVSAKGRVIAFGDPAQAIYAFRGAGKNSLPLLKERFNAVSLPLSICYRCSKAVVKYAQQYVPHIQAFEGAVEGKVAELPTWSTHTLGPEDVVLCRNNAPLVKLAFRVLRSGTVCRILGRDIGTGLTALVQRMKAVTSKELVEKLGKYQDREREKLNEDEFRSLLDRIDTVKVFAENCGTVAEILAKIEVMFADEQGACLTLSTIHRAKGTEFPRVFILDFDLIGARNGMTQEEQNIAYVAITRAQRELFFIRS